jgi:hypothetical protein
MRTIADTLQPHDMLLLGEAQPVLGTAMLGNAFGIIRRCFLTRTGERVEFKDQAERLRILLINNPGWICQFEVLFDADVEAPGLLAEIELPLIGVMGRVMDGASVEWNDGTERILSIPCAQWDNMLNAVGYLLDPADGSITLLPEPAEPPPVCGGFFGGFPLAA